jgi:hypothetical protein
VGGADIPRLVYCPTDSVTGLARWLDGLPGVQVIGTRQPASLGAVLAFGSLFGQYLDDAIVTLLKGIPAG